MHCHVRDEGGVVGTFLVLGTRRLYMGHLASVTFDDS